MLNINYIKLKFKIIIIIIIIISIVFKKINKYIYFFF